MEINLDDVIGFAPPSYEAKWNRRDAIIYALGVGSDESELQYIYELNDAFSVLPSFLSCLPFKGDSFDVLPFPPPPVAVIPPGLLNSGANLAGGLFGEQSIEFYAPIPLEATVICSPKVVAFKDMGSAALMEIETLVRMKGEDKIVAKLTAGSVFRGMGGFDKEKKVSSAAKVSYPKREPDLVDEMTTNKNQSMLFRLSGDYNPLHIDTDFAQSFGFKQPIMHGLASYGFVARSVIRKCCNNDPRNLLSLNVRFASPVYPGETLIIKLWMDKTNRVLIQATVKERGVVVINNSHARIKLSTLSAALKSHL